MNNLMLSSKYLLHIKKNFCLGFMYFLIVCKETKKQKNLLSPFFNFIRTNVPKKKQKQNKKPKKIMTEEILCKSPILYIDTISC